jgi:hypothetical protein
LHVTTFFCRSRTANHDDDNGRDADCYNDADDNRNLAMLTTTVTLPTTTAVTATTATQA